MIWISKSDSNCLVQALLRLASPREHITTQGYRIVYLPRYFRELQRQ